MKTKTKPYYVGIFTNWSTNRINLLVTPDRNQIPPSVKDLQTVFASSKKEARNNYLFAQL